MGITGKMIRSFEGRSEIQDTRNLIEDTMSLIQAIRSSIQGAPIQAKDGRSLIQVSRSLT
jgi:hypothetical protein